MSTLLMMEDGGEPEQQQIQLDDDDDDDDDDFSSSSSSSDFRVILLLDMDCFYAQCECIRLGLDAATVPLCLMQWNSCLAVTYPARKQFGIERIDSWQTIHEKSSGKCLAVHVPVLTFESSLEQTSNHGASSPTPTTASSIIPTNSTSPLRPLHASSLAEEYSAMFDLTPAQQEQARNAELGVRRNNKEGKASIERYRIASARIFEVVYEFLQKCDPTIVLERASIDEFFLDVTACCNNSSSNKNKDEKSNPVFRFGDSGSDTDEDAAFARTKTNVIGNENTNTDDYKLSSSLDPQVRALRRGCIVAHAIRQRVFETLGFTLSAGISINKTLAKLSAGYGKPNGQAVTFPDKYQRHISFLLNDTKISKCRNLGGKLGARVKALLPVGVPATVGSIARYLSLVQLQRGLAANGDNSNDDAVARWVWDICHGRDSEAVVAKMGSSSSSSSSSSSTAAAGAGPLVKSITAFKQFGGQSKSLDECASWIHLLAVEIVNRVERDAALYRRYPRTCTVQYRTKTAATAAVTNQQQQNGSKTVGKSVRTNFPAERLSTHDKIRELVENVPQRVRAKEGRTNAVRLQGIGLCAVDFVNRTAANQSIGTYFATTTTVIAATNANMSNDKTNDNDEKHKAENNKSLLTHQDFEQKQSSLQQRQEETVVADADLALAKQLQKAYDGEIQTAQMTEEAKARALRKNVQPPHPRQQQQQQRASLSNSRKHHAEVVDPDLALAMRLQANYDREFRVLEAAASQQQQRAPKIRRIDTFFQKR